MTQNLNMDIVLSPMVNNVYSTLGTLVSRFEEFCSSSDILNLNNLETKNKSFNNHTYTIHFIYGTRLKNCVDKKNKFNFFIIKTLIELKYTCITFFWC